jgi:urea transport system substrate-binding protein
MKRMSSLLSTGRSCGVTAALLASLAMANHAAFAADPIQIGVPVGLSGANSVVAPSVVQAAQLVSKLPMMAAERRARKRLSTP